MVGAKIRVLNDLQDLVNEAIFRDEREKAVVEAVKKFVKEEDADCGWIGYTVESADVYIRLDSYGTDTTITIISPREEYDFSQHINQWTEPESVINQQLCKLIEEMYEMDGKGIKDSNCSHCDYPARRKYFYRIKSGVLLYIRFEEKVRCNCPTY